MIFIEFSPDFSAEEFPTLDIGQLERAAREALQHPMHTTSGDLTLVLSDEKLVRQLNSEYLGIDEPTDVLSFPAGEIDPDTHSLYLGDVIISIPIAKAQASERALSLRDELYLLVVHGVLHLLGYDHVDEAEKQKMWSLQREILKRLGCEYAAPEY